jgi:hypothetical protein
MLSRVKSSTPQIRFKELTKLRLLFPQCCHQRTKGLTEEAREELLKKYPHAVDKDSLIKMYEESERAHKYFSVY